MDNPGVSLFQNADLKLSNSQNIEEEEDLEDQRRRNEELQNLLMAKLDDFNYDESTINSSNNASVVSIDDIQNKYRSADPYEQLKVLYDVRLRELNSLRVEYETVKQEMLKENEALKNKIFIFEAELQQTKVSLKNANELLVDKSSTIAELKEISKDQSEQMKNYERTIENYRLEISTYQSTINDLQVQIQRDINPFHSEAGRFTSEESQKAYQEKIEGLESLLEGHTKAAKIYERDKMIAQSEIQKLLEQESDYKNTINILTKNFDSAQKQCEDLINVIEMLTKENKHLQDRIDLVYNKSPPVNPNESNNLGNHIEKLKKMLLDKSVQIDSLNSKVRAFENDVKELLEYRQLKNDVYKKEFQQCENKDHIKSLLLMQNDLQNYRRTIEDKNQQILTLNSTNRDLLEKMEGMLSQTRNDIEQFSHKYNLPQLEKMTEDLREAEKKIKELEEKLERSEGKRLSLVQRIQKTEKTNEKDLKKEFDMLKLNSDKEKNDYENKLKKLHKDLSDSVAKIENLQQHINELLSENSKLINQLKECNEKTKNENSLKKQHYETVQKLHESHNTIRKLEETVEELTSLKTMSDGEKCTYQSQATDYRNQLTDTQKILEGMKEELNELSAKLDSKENIIDELQHSLKNSKSEISDLKDKLSSKEIALKLAVDTKNELTELLQKANLELEATKKDVFNQQSQEAEVAEKNVRRNLQKELEEIEEQKPSNVKTEVDDAVDMMKVEIRLREEIQEEYFKKLNEIEKKYKKVCTSSNELYKEQVEIVKSQENKFRECLATVVNECVEKIKQLEEDREELIKQLNILQNEFKTYKVQASHRTKVIENMLKESEQQNKKDDENWRTWSKEFVNNCLKIEKTNKKSRDSILCKMQTADSEVAAIEKSYNEKIRKYVKNCKI